MKEETFRQFEAVYLYCPHCKASKPVEKRLLLVLPDGEKYDYICKDCRNPIGGKLEKRPSLLPPEDG